MHSESLEDRMIGTYFGGIIILGVMVFLIAAFTCYDIYRHPQEKKANILWSAETQYKRILVNGTTEDCILEGIDEAGFVRWKSVVCPGKSKTGP